MNSFNRLSYTYRFIFNRKILFDNDERCSKFCVLKKIPIFAIRKKQLKHTVMECLSGALEEKRKGWEILWALTKIRNVISMNNVGLFAVFEIEFVNEDTGQLVNLTATCGSYRELGRYLTEMGKKQWRMLKVTRKGN